MTLFACDASLSSASLSLPLPSKTHSDKRNGSYDSCRGAKKCVCVRRKKGWGEGFNPHHNGHDLVPEKNASTHCFFYKKHLTGVVTFSVVLWTSCHRGIQDIHACNKLCICSSFTLWCFSMFLMTRVSDRCSSCLHSFITSPPPPGGLAAALCLQEDSEIQLQESKRKCWIYKKKRQSKFCINAPSDVQSLHPFFKPIFSLLFTLFKGKKYSKLLCVIFCAVNLLLMFTVCNICTTCCSATRKVTKVSMNLCIEMTEVWTDFDAKPSNRIWDISLWE